MLGVAVPAAAVGPQRCAALTQSWFNHVIAPATVRGGWYPEHINQSLSGVVSRYFLAGPNGDIYWGPDDDPHYQGTEHGWITLKALPEWAAKAILRSGQLAIVLLLAWAIGWRILPRDDGRRAMHYGMVVLAMLLLNQRTWQHHVAVMLPGAVAIWQGIAAGQASRRARAWALGLVAVAGGLLALARGEVFEAIARLTGRHGQAAEAFADACKAFGPTFYYVAFLFAAAVILSVSLKKPGSASVGEHPQANDALGRGSE
jgi:hypothetical protein